MRFVTRCPACRALFEVHERQLQACEGWLRCGQCFNAFDSTGLVLSWSPVSAPEYAPDGSEVALSVPRIDIRSLLHQHDSPPTLSGQPVHTLFQQLVPPSLDLDGPSVSRPSSISVSASSPSPLTPRPPAGKDRSLHMAAQTGMPSETLSTQAVIPASGPGVPVTTAARKPVLASGRQNVQWVLACIAALLLLVGQGVQTQLSGLQLAAPALQGWGQRLCTQLGCDWPVVRMPVVVQLESARLLREEDRLVLSLRVRNTASIDVAFGALELSLLGHDAAVLVRRVLGPDAIGAPAVLSAGAVWEGQLQLLMNPLEQVQGFHALMFLP